MERYLNIFKNTKLTFPIFCSIRERRWIKCPLTYYHEIFAFLQSFYNFLFRELLESHELSFESSSVPFRTTDLHFFIFGFFSNLFSLFAWGQAHVPCSPFLLSIRLYSHRHLREKNVEVRVILIESINPRQKSLLWRFLKAKRTFLRCSMFTLLSRDSPNMSCKILLNLQMLLMSLQKLLFGHFFA
jgi:hypothetical protein